MILGEIVEALIRMRDCNLLILTEDEAVCAACNILDKLPTQMHVETAGETLGKFTAAYMEVKSAEATLNKMQGGGQLCDDAIKEYRNRKRIFQHRKSMSKTAV